MFLRRLQVVPETDPSADCPLMSKQITNSDGTTCWAVRLYNAGSALTTGRPYVVAATGAEATCWNVITPAALAVYQYVVIALEDVAASSWGWFAIQGFCDAMVDGTADVADLDYLDVTPGTSTTALIFDHGTVRSTASVARACAAQATNSAVSTRVQLLGDPVIIP